MPRSLLPGAARPPISGRLGLQAELEGSGLSPVALAGSLHGSGKFTSPTGGSPASIRAPSILGHPRGRSRLADRRRQDCRSCRQRARQRSAVVRHFRRGRLHSKRRPNPFDQGRRERRGRRRSARRAVLISPFGTMDAPGRAVGIGRIRRRAAGYFPGVARAVGGTGANDRCIGLDRLADHARG